MKNNPTNITSEGASKKLVPEFRFPEFVNDDEWISTSLGNKCIYVSSGKNKEKKEKGEFPVYGSTGVIGYSGSFVYDFPAILVARVGANAGQINKVTGKYDVTDNTIIIQLNDDCNLDYVYYFLASRNINIFVFGSGQPLITSSLLKKLILSLPSLSEQKRIAQCLSSLDELIAATKEKVELLKVHKRGLIQKLFPAKGKAAPNLRFHEFMNNEVWIDEPIGKTYKVQGGFAFKSAEFKNNGIPIIRISNIPNDSISVDLTHCAHYQELPNMSNFIVRYGSLVIAMSGATTGKSALYKQEKIAYLNQRVGLFKSITSSNEYSFLCQWIQSDFFVTQLSKLLAAGALPNISSNDIESITWNYPKNIKEQQKIASTLLSIDDLIELYYEKVRLLELHKRGLIQKLFCI